MITQKYKLDMITDKVLPFVHISQYDSSRTIVFYLYENGTEYIPTDATISLNGQTINGTVSGNTFTFEVDSTFTQNSGDFYGELRDSGMGSLNFILRVDSTPTVLPNTHDETLDRALSILLGRNVTSNQSAEALNILFGGER